MKLFSFNEILDLADISKPTFYRNIKNKKIPYVEFENEKYIKEDTFNSLVSKYGKKNTLEVEEPAITQQDNVNQDSTNELVSVYKEMIAMQKEMLLSKDEKISKLEKEISNMHKEIIADKDKQINSLERKLYKVLELEDTYRAGKLEIRGS